MEEHKKHQLRTLYQCFRGFFHIQCFILLLKYTATHFLNRSLCLSNTYNITIFINLEEIRTVVHVIIIPHNHFWNLGTIDKQAWHKKSFPIIHINQQNAIICKSCTLIWCKKVAVSLQMARGGEPFLPIRNLRALFRLIHYFIFYMYFLSI